MVSDDTLQPRRFWPVDFGDRRPDCLRQMLDGLSDHLQVEQDRIEPGFIGGEFIEGPVLYDSADFLCRCDQIVEVKQPSRDMD